MPEPTPTIDRTPRHALPYLFPGQAQKEAFVNEAMARLDALIQPVARAELAEPPASPTAGDCYIVANPASGSWAGHERQLAAWTNGQWVFAAPSEGARVHDAASGGLAVFTAAAGWQRAAAPPAPAGGSTQDIEARTAITAIVARLHSLGIFSA